MTHLPRPEHDVHPAAAISGPGRTSTSRTPRLDVPANQMWIRAGTLLASGQRLAMIAAHRDGRTASGGRSLRLVYVFTDGPPGQITELQVRMNPDRPFVTTLAGLSAPAALFEADLTASHGVVFADPPPHGPLSADLATALSRAGRLPRPRDGERSRRDAASLAKRIAASTDTPVGHTLAYCLAVEDATGRPVAAHTAGKRMVLLELERLHRHLTDLGMTVQIAGRHRLHAQVLHLREQLLRLNHLATGNRLLRGSVMPGGALLRAIDPDHLHTLTGQIAEFTADALEDTVLQARLDGLAVLSTARARDLGALGFIARASGVDNDARRTHPFTAQDLPPAPADDRGDALARFRVRAQELLTSAILIATGTGAGTRSRTPHPGDSEAPSVPGTASAGVGIVEGWRGAIVSRVELDPTGTVTALITVDASYLNRAVAGAVGDSTPIADLMLARGSLHTLTDGPQL